MSELSAIVGPYHTYSQEGGQRTHQSPSKRYACEVLSVRTKVSTVCAFSVIFTVIFTVIGCLPSVVFCQAAAALGSVKCQVQLGSVKCQV